MNKSIIKIGFAAYVLLTGVAHGTAFAQDAPELKVYNVSTITPTPEGLAHELSEQAKSIGILQDQIDDLAKSKEDKDPSKNLMTAENFNSIVLDVEDLKTRQKLVEDKISRIIKILKLHTEK